MTKHNTLKCPHCNHELDIDKVLFAQIEGQLQTEYIAKQKKLEDELAQKSEAVIKQQKELEQKQKDFDTQIAEKVASQLSDEKKKLLEVAKKEAMGELELQIKDKDNQAEEYKKKLADAQKNELELMKQKRELEEKQQAIDLELEKKLADERKKIQEESGKLFDEKLKSVQEADKLKLAEKDKQIDLMKQSLEEANRRAEQGSMQIQGEVQENSLKEVLQRAFPVDRIEDVPTGIRGADLVQRVNNHYGQSGIILWESKNTKEWSNEWVNKLKEDMKLINADMGIIITRVMPKDIENFGNIDGIWVSEPRFAIPLANILRTQIEAVKESKQALVGQGTKMEAIYEYLLSTKFKNHMVSIITAFETMQDDLNKEKKAIQKQWSKRQTQLDRALAGSTSLYGDLQGIIGKSLPEIEELELDAGDKKLLKGDDDE
jgi:hypothetical protein